MKRPNPRQGTKVRKRRKYDHDTGTIVELVNTAVSNALALQAASQAAHGALDVQPGGIAGGLADTLVTPQRSRVELAVTHTMKNKGQGKGNQNCRK